MFRSGSSTSMSGSRSQTSRRPSAGGRLQVRKSLKERLPLSARSRSARGILWRRYTYGTLIVYSLCMSVVRTNIEIEDDYVEAIMDRYGVRTKTAAVNLALRHLAGQPMTIEEARAMRGGRAISAVPADAPPRSAA